jgi:hypothetical protein
MLAGDDIGGYTHDGGIFPSEDIGNSERRLLFAVLEDGLSTLLKHASATRGRARRLRAEALEWLLSTARTEVFDFEHICDVLGIDAERLRRRVLAAMGPQPLDPTRWT